MAVKGAGWFLKSRGIEKRRTDMTEDRLQFHGILRFAQDDLHFECGELFY
jgi:hypothetical protein